MVQRTLAKKWRWDDAAYLGRIVFCDLLDGDRSETGYGLSPSVCDNEHDFLRLDLDKQRVERVNPDTDKVTAAWSFTQYIALDLDEVKGLKDF